MATHLSLCSAVLPCSQRRPTQLKASNRDSPGQLTTSELSSKIESWTRRSVEAVVKSPVLFEFVKPAAKKWIMFMADQKGVPWTKRVDQFQQDVDILEDIKESTEDLDLVYPDYYLKSFHAYKDGNLSWLAAFEVESAYEILCFRAAPDGCEDHLEAKSRVARRIADSIKERVGSEISSVLDMGCGVGISSMYLAHGFPNARVTGIDPSPYFVSFAKHTTPKELNIDYRHMLGEQALDHFQPNSFDVVTIIFVVHECPPHIIQKLFDVAATLCRSGGVVALVETHTQSTGLRQLPLPIKALQQSTEPYLVDYLELDVAETLKKSQLVDVQQKMISKRHAIWTGVKP